MPSRLLIAVVIIAAVGLGIAVYTGATGKSTVLSKAVGTVISPLQKGVSRISGALSQGYAYFAEFDELKAENEELKAQLRDTEQQLRDAQVALEENNHLRALLGIKERNRSFELEIAEVIARSPGDWSSTLSLDKGTTSGIETGDLVMTEDGMVGYVSGVSPTWCEVTTVLDVGMQAGAMITRTREVAIAQGDYSLMNEGYLRLSYLEADSSVVIGDTVETSGRGGVFPKGIMIGTIERIIPEENGISNYAVLKPFVDIQKVSTVFIIKDFEITE